MARIHPPRIVLAIRLYACDFELTRLDRIGFFDASVQDPSPLRGACLQSERSHGKGLAIGFFGVLVLSPDAFLIRSISVEGWTLVFWRGLLMGTTLLIGIAAVTRSDFFRTVKGIGKTGVIAALLQATGSICFVMSILNTQVANTLIILAALPMFVAVFSTVFLKEHAPTHTWLAIPVSALGIGITVYEGVSLGYWKGDLLALCTACCGSGHLILLRFAKGRNMTPSAALGGLIGAAFASTMAPTLVVPDTDVLYVGLLGCAIIPIAFTCFVTAPRFIPAPEISLIVLLEMVLGPFWVWLGIGERPTDAALVGGGIVLCTLLVHSVVALKSEHSA